MKEMLLIQVTIRLDRHKLLTKIQL